MIHSRKVCHACVSMPRDFLCGVCDAPAEDVRAVGDEPVGYFTFCHDKNRWVQGKPKGPEFIHLFTPLYHRPQHQVVLPDRMTGETASCFGWNACLDEIERLNKCPLN